MSSIVANQLLTHTQQMRDAAKEELAEGVLQNKTNAIVASLEMAGIKFLNLMILNKEVVRD